MLTRDLQHGARSTVKRGSHRTAQVMQSDVNPHTSGSITSSQIQTVTHRALPKGYVSHVLWIFDTRYIKYKTQQRDGLEAAMVLQKDNWFPRLVNSVGGIGVTIGYHVIWLVNSVGHFWGSRSWKTKDTSRNVWWLSLFTMGDSWHNNHHAFETSARHGFEWWQIDITWYLIRLFEILGLATDVKLPSEFQKQKMSLSCSS
ncbi:unnamed protein product [Brassica oleracea var. botrytis]